MKMEFLSTGHRRCPLIRLFAYTTHDVNRLRLAALDLAYSHTSRFALHEQAWCESIANCRMIWEHSVEDLGITTPRQGEPFTLALAQEGWLEVEGKLQPFADGFDRYSFQWLTNEGEVSLLISPDGLS